MHSVDPKVSVVLPVYNGSRYVAEAIESVLAQTHRNVEVIAVDDGSPDDSLDVLRSFGDSIRVISQTNRGVAGARNRGIAESTGNYIAFLDQDDWWAPEKLALQLSVFQADSEIGLVHTAVTHMSANGVKELPPLNPNSVPSEIQGSCYDRLLCGNSIYNSSVVARNEAIRKVGPCDVQLAGNTVADYELWLRLAKQYKFGFVEQQVTYYRMHEDQGIWDRRSMLSAEINVLLKQQPEDVWIKTRAGRERLGMLYDELAVSHFDFAEYEDARRCFTRALHVSRTRRASMRWLVSRLPARLINRLRRKNKAIAN